MAIYDYKTLMDGCVTKANKAMAIGDRISAERCLLEGAEYALKLARDSFAEKRTTYFKKAKNLQELAAVAHEKAKSESVGLDNKGSESATVTVQKSISNSDSLAYEKNPMSKSLCSGSQPMKLEDYYGQPIAVTKISYAISASLLKNTALPHILLYGSHGLGKTTLANIVANEMNANFIEVSTSGLTPDDLISILKKLKDGDILYIDEIHTLPSVVAETVLYSALQDYKISYTEGKGADAKPISVSLNHFTLIGATTEIGKLPKPLVQRMTLQCRLVAYGEDVIRDIIVKTFSKLGLGIVIETASLIAKRCRNNPRIANGMVRGIADMSIFLKAKELNMTAKGSLTGIEQIKMLGIIIDEQVVTKFFEENGIDVLGLECGDREYLKTLVVKYHGGPVSMETLAKSLNESANVITDKYEDYLIRLGMVKIGSRGRIATPTAFNHLGLEAIAVEEAIEGEKPTKMKDDSVTETTPKTVGE